MADVKISALPAASAGAVADLVPIVQSGTTKYVTIANLLKVAPVIGGTTPAAGSFTTLNISGTVTGTGTGAPFVFTGATTSERFLIFGNTGANARFGVESSVGGQVFTGSSAYAMVVGVQEAQPIQFATSNAIRMTVAASGNLLIGTNTETASAGLLQLATGTTAASGIVMGTDSNIFRTGAAAIHSNSAWTLDSSSTATSFIPSGATVPSNGMYLIAPNRLGFATASTARIEIDATGRVGFNQVPSAYLDITGPVDTAITIRAISSGTGGAFLQLTSAGAGNEIETTAAGDLVFTAAGVVANVFTMTHAAAQANTLVLTAGNISTIGSITTGAPTGGTAAAWKVGVAGSASITSPDKYVTVDVAGTLYYIPAKLTAN